MEGPTRGAPHIVGRGSMPVANCFAVGFVIALVCGFVVPG